MHDTIKSIKLTSIQQPAVITLGALDKKDENGIESNNEEDVEYLNYLLEEEELLKNSIRDQTEKSQLLGNEIHSILLELKKYDT